MVGNGAAAQQAEEKIRTETYMKFLDTHPITRVLLAKFHAAKPLRHGVGTLLANKREKKRKQRKKKLKRISSFCGVVLSSCPVPLVVVVLVG